jgi:hypothetical protein
MLILSVPYSLTVVVTVGTTTVSVVTVVGTVDVAVLSTHTLVESVVDSHFSVPPSQAHDVNNTATAKIVKIFFIVLFVVCLVIILINTYLYC